MENQIGKLIADIEELKCQLPKEVGKKLDLDLNIRLVNRLDSLSSDCEECRRFLHIIDELNLLLKESGNDPTKENLKEYKGKVNSILSHLQKEHGLITEGYYTGLYMSTFMSIGVSLGLVFGMTVFDNISMGIPIGIGIGIAIGAGVGASQDAEAKKKDKVI